MAIYDFKCDNPECDNVEEYIVSPSVVDPIPEVCPKCLKGKLEKQISGSNVSFDVLGGYEYTYGKKNWRKGKSAIDQAGHLVKGDDGKYKDPY